jgi:hypothetical protein
MKKSELDKQDKYIKALMDISRAITSDQYLEDILKLILMVTAKVTGVEICSLWLIDETVDPPMLGLKASQTIDREYVKDRSLGMSEGVVGHVATTRKPLIVENVLAEPARRLIVGYRSAAWTRGNPCVRLPKPYCFQKSFKPDPRSRRDDISWEMLSNPDMLLDVPAMGPLILFRMPARSLS